MERKIASLFIILSLDDVMTYSFLVYLNIETLHYPSYQVISRQTSSAISQKTIKVSLISPAWSYRLQGRIGLKSETYWIEEYANGSRIFNFSDRNLAQPKCSCLHFFWSWLGRGLQFRFGTILLIIVTMDHHSPS